MTANFILEKRLSADVPPVFSGLAAGEPVLVELDNSATYKLAGKARGEAISPAIEAGHAQVQAAAARLFEMGAFLKRSPAGIKCIRLSALDLD